MCFKQREAPTSRDKATRATQAPLASCEPDQQGAGSLADIFKVLNEYRKALKLVFEGQL